MCDEPFNCNLPGELKATCGMDKGGYVVSVPSGTVCPVLSWNDASGTKFSWAPDSSTPASPTAATPDYSDPNVLVCSYSFDQAPATELPASLACGVSSGLPKHICALQVATAQLDVSYKLTPAKSPPRALPPYVSYQGQIIASASLPAASACELPIGIIRTKAIGGTVHCDTCLNGGPAVW
jgi:hypothetical protein